MSTLNTTATDLDRATIRLIASDYAIHQTGNRDSEVVEEARADLAVQSEAERIDPTTEPHPGVPGVTNPTWWPSTQHRRVPDYAPINHELVREVRPVGANLVIGVLMSMTFSGCSLIAMYAAIWRNTGGRVFDRAFRYEVGGEF
ncbi:hypothetical protein P152DRAFT_406043 [Eremomyces bilateralis CBS 781.70]|uniref:Uncharacterized protein n=1 Tax=Eremomyces bilateralis CBS 781.70 TaxID=1392243 RepID=A0A6G1FQY9_9PEZI|nr:uncharacterized protein P152DRAFT_406043 [Eremomyces bilateralis CBS 781.70]KAF1808148.1 hypothetical protein P152DRAFT_406043 [Eremomyces bilateralis CBS 781.70]